jgi:hypothetical protein
MASSTFSATYTSSQTISIPANATNISIQVAAARGGTGGFDANTPGGTYGAGRFGTFNIQPSFVARNLQFNIGSIGGDGNSSQSNAPGGGGGGGVASGGTGGRAGPQGSSGGGGGGGGATGVYDSYSGSWIIVAGGGGGGGGAAYPGVNGLIGDVGLNWVGSVSPISNGGNGGNCPSDGSGGGGGGGGASGGGGGYNGFDVSAGNVNARGGFGGGSGYNTTYASLTSSNINNGNGYIFIQYTLLTPQINNFSANPNPQTSGSDGIQNYDTTLSWNVSDASSVSISNIGAVGTSGSTSITNLPQSTSGSNSPATRSYTLTACAGSTCVNQTITVEVFNDNTPDNYIISNQSNLEPNTLTTTSTTTITGIDMQTTVSAGPGVQVSNNSVNWSGSVLVSNNNQIFARAVSPPFNTDPSGLTNSSQFYIDIGPVRRFFTLTTRAPDVSETFNFANEDDRVPYPDIDTITTPPDNPAEPYISSNTLNVDDIEIPVEVKTNNSNIQIRVKRAGASSWENWQDTRSI